MGADVTRAELTAIWPPNADVAREIDALTKVAGTRP
jgi:hypothetical protein